MLSKWHLSDVVIMKVYNYIEKEKTVSKLVDLKALNYLLCQEKLEHLFMMFILLQFNIKIVKAGKLLKIEKCILLT